MELKKNMENWFYECYSRMIKTNYDPGRQIGWIKNVMYYSRTLRDDAVDWIDIVDDIIAGDYFEKWANTDSVKYNFEHFTIEDLPRLKNQCSKYITSIATNKINGYNKKNEYTDNEAKLSTDEYDFDFGQFPDENEEDFNEEEYDDQMMSLADMLHDKNKYKKLNDIYDLIISYLENDYESSENMKIKLRTYIDEKIKNPYLTQVQACDIAGLHHMTMRKFIKTMRRDERFLKKIHFMGIFFENENK